MVMADDRISDFVGNAAAQKALSRKCRATDEMASSKPSLLLSSSGRFPQIIRRNARVG
jgi:hypothetical protein